MGIWSKLKFWGNKEEFGKFPDIPQMPGEPGAFPDLNLQSFGANQGQGVMGMSNTGQSYGYPNQYPTFEPVQQNNMPRNVSFPGSSMQQPEFVGKDIEVISAKLDALRASLESINQRLANLERVAYGEFEQKRGPRW